MEGGGLQAGRLGGGRKAAGTVLRDGDQPPGVGGAGPEASRRHVCGGQGAAGGAMTSYRRSAVSAPVGEAAP